MKNTELETQQSGLLRRFLTIQLSGLLLKERIGFKSRMREHPCYCGEEKDEVYLFLDSPEEKESTIEYLTKALRKKGIRTQVNRRT